MKLLESLGEALSALKGESGLTLLLGDWDAGLKLMEEQTDNQTIEQVKAAEEKYGARFTWRAFNENLEVSWNGEGGTFCNGAPAEENKRCLFLETDYRRFPGVGVFWTKDFENERYNRAEVEEIRQGGHVVHLRLLRLFWKEEKGDGSHP